MIQGELLGEAAGKNKGGEEESKIARLLVIEDWG